MASKFGSTIIITIVILATFMAGLTVYFLLQNQINPRPSSKNTSERQIYVNEGAARVRQEVARCGDYPREDELRIKAGHFTALSGPEWSPDCQNVAWSQFESGIEVNSEVDAQMQEIFDPPNSENNGLYVYNVKSRKTIKLLSGKPSEPALSLAKWLDDNNLEYSVNKETGPELKSITLPKNY